MHRRNPKQSLPSLRLVSRFAKKGGHVHTIYTNSDPWGSSWNGAKELFVSIAEKGHGKSVELKDERRLIEDIVRVTLGTESREEVRKLFQTLDEGHRVDRIRRRLRKHDARFVKTFLKKTPLDSQIPLEIIRHNHENFLVAYLDILRDDKVKIENRWLTTVLLRRLLRHIGKYHALPQEAQTAVSSFHPELTKSKQKRLLDNLAQSLYDTGLLDQP